MSRYVKVEDGKPISFGITDDNIRVAHPGIRKNDFRIHGYYPLEERPKPIPNHDMQVVEEQLPTFDGNKCYQNWIVRPMTEQEEAYYYEIEEYNRKYREFLLSQMADIDEDINTKNI
jgi:hypothetical protein